MGGGIDFNRKAVCTRPYMRAEAKGKKEGIGTLKGILPYL